MPENTNSEQEGEVQYPYVVRGATIYCNCGSHKRKLDMPASHGSYIRDKAMMNKDDCVVGLDQNIPPFGACRAEGKEGIDIKINDGTDALPGMDENGNLVEMPLPIEGKLCEPNLCQGWLDAHETTLVDGKPALTVNSTITCCYGGTIAFIDAGQDVY